MPYRIVFCGTPEFAAPSLCALFDDPNFQIEKVYPLIQNLGLVTCGQPFISVDPGMVQVPAAL